jgi:hypothetical protein
LKKKPQKSASGAWGEKTALIASPCQEMIKALTLEKLGNLFRNCLLGNHSAPLPIIISAKSPYYLGDPQHLNL